MLKLINPSYFEYFFASCLYLFLFFFYQNILGFIKTPMIEGNQEPSGFRCLADEKKSSGCFAV